MEDEDGLLPKIVAQKYNDVLVSGTQPFLWTKLMFIGQGRAGKTSLLKNLTNQPFNPDEEITDGADVCVVNNSAWEKMEHLNDANYEKGVAEVVGAQLKEVVSVYQDCKKTSRLHST